MSSEIKKYEPFQLVYTNPKTKKADTFGIVYRNPSGAVAKVIYECIDEMPEGFGENNLQDKASVILRMSKYIDDTISDANTKYEKALTLAYQDNAINADDIKLMTANKKQLKGSDLLKINELYYTMFKAIIDMNQLTEEHRKLINQDINSDFWLNQDIRRIKEEVNRFRNLIE